MGLISTTKTYDFSQNFVSIDGLPITGFGEGGSIEYEYPGERFTHVSGADGLVTVSRQNDRRMLVTLTIMETADGPGEGYNNLAELFKKQNRDRQPEIIPMPYLHRDRLNGDSVKSEYAIFIPYPTPSKERDAGEREFQLLLPHAAEDVEWAGVNNYSLG